MTDHSAPTRGEVTQGDREAAATYLERTRNMPCHYGDMREGLEDDHRLVQAFAAHRLATIEECAKAIADLPTGRTEEVMEGHEDAYRAIERLRNLGRGA